MLENLIGQSSHVLPSAVSIPWLIVLGILLVLIARKFFNIPFFTLLLILILPALIHSNSGSTSFGLMLSSLIIFGSSLSFSDSKQFNNILPRKFILFTFVFFVIILLHGFLSFHFYSDTFHLNRFAVSIAGLFTMIVASYIFTYKFLNVGVDELTRIMQWAWYLVIFLTILVLIRFAVFSPIYNYNLTTLAVFSENSHFVLACLPFFLFKFIISNSYLRLLILTILISMAFAVKSATLLIGVGLCFLILDSSVITRKTIFYYVIFLLTFLYLYLTFIHSHLSDINPIRYILDRIFDFFRPVSINTNMSTLAVQKEWHEAIMNVMQTKGFGIGYQQSGIHGFQSYMSDLIQIQSSSGGTRPTENIPWVIKFETFSIAPKLISEFGILGILAITFYLRYFVDSFIYLRNIIVKKVYKTDYLDILFHCFYVLFFISLFVRGTGYFSVATFFFLTSIIYLFVLKKNE